MKYPAAAENSMTRRGFAAILIRGSIGFVAVAAGCGGGGGGSSPSGSAPTAATRSRVLSLHDTSVRGTLQSGFQSASFAFARNDYAGGGYGYGTGAGGDAPTSEDSGAVVSGATMPMLGAFLRNIAATAPNSRAAHLHSFKTRQEKGDGGTGEGGGATPGDGGMVPPGGGYYDPPPSFYFDYYLGLWVQIDEAGGNYNYLLFDDEAKTKPAGHITTVSPTDWETYPQVFKSSYAFDSGYLSGSHGSSENITKADYSGSSTYENVYADGWKDSGSSRWSTGGDFSWSSRTDGVNKEWNEASGSFFSDGSGGTRLSSSDGYKSDYRYNADGSGHGRITGPDPGLPVSISWDAFGNTTITYADGSTEHINGWGSEYGGGVDDPVPIDIEGPIAVTP